VRHPIPPILATALLILAAATPAFAQPTITIDATKPIRTVDDRMFGVNTAIWDSTFNDGQTQATLQGMDARFMRYPGGSASDDYNWATNQNTEGTTTWSTDFDHFASVAKAVNSQVIITANYGTGTPAMAAAWVQYSNVTKGYGFKYWEIGNECYGTWEDDAQAVQHDPYTYAMRAVQYIQAMKAVDPTIKIGMVAVPGEDSYANNNQHPATNPVTKVVHNGWTPVMLATLKSQGVYPDFLIYHNYEFNEGQEDDSVLLQDEVISTNNTNTGAWFVAGPSLRTMLTDYLGSSGAGIELVCTENNSVSTSPGKQSVSVVNGLYYADSVANLMKTEFNGMIWWDLHNGPGNTGTNEGSNLYGWRLYGDYGVENGPVGTLDPIAHDKYPTYYAFKLMQHFARGGDTVLTASSNNLLLSGYATHRTDDSMSILVINKSPVSSYTADINITGYVPQSNATVYSYGIPQDLYSEENASVVSTPTTNSFSFEGGSYDGWVNQSGIGDNAADNYGLNAPFLYTLGFSQTVGVTQGESSLEASTPVTTPGNSAVIQINNTSYPGLATLMGGAASVTMNIYPQVGTGGDPAPQVSLYVNGSDRTDLNYQLLSSSTGTAITLSPNQENTVTFTLTAAQRAGFLASTAWCQAGINIESQSPINVYFDNIVVTPLATPTPTPTPTPLAGAASSPDIAVSTLTTAGPSFSATFGPYTATVLSLTKVPVAPAFTAQPQSQTLASGSTVVLTAPASGVPAPSYQWYLNGTAIPSATSSTLVISGATAANAGAYTCEATNSTSTVTSATANISITTTSNPGRLVNLSCRALTEAGSNQLIAGYVVGGAGTSGTLPLLIRASGPALAGFGVSGTIPDPELTLNQSKGTINVLVGTNSGWADNATVASTAASVGAFAWTATSTDAALVETLSPGAYTAQVTGVSNDSGVTLAEVYDATPSGSYTPSNSRLINISARVEVGTGGNVLIAGFVIGGTTSKTVLIRGSGPVLTSFGLSGVLPDPQLMLYKSNTDGSNTLLQTNTGWGGNPTIASAAASVGAFSWGSAATPDSAILVTLPPGAYTAQVAGASGDVGISLVEVYEVP